MATTRSNFVDSLFNLVPPLCTRVITTHTHAHAHAHLHLHLAGAFIQNVLQYIHTMTTLVVQLVCVKLHPLLDAHILFDRSRHPDTDLPLQSPHYCVLVKRHRRSLVVFPNNKQQTTKAKRWKSTLHNGG